MQKLLDNFILQYDIRQTNESNYLYKIIYIFLTIDSFKFGFEENLDFRRRTIRYSVLIWIST